MTCAPRAVRLYQNVWYGVDNDFTLALMKVSPDGVRSPADLTSVSRMELSVAGSTLAVEFNQPGAPIDWWTVGPMSGEVTFMLGKWVEQEAIPQGAYPVKLVVFDPIHSGGILWLSASTGDLTLRIHEN